MTATYADEEMKKFFNINCIIQDLVKPLSAQSTIHKCQWCYDFHHQKCLP